MLKTVDVVGLSYSDFGRSCEQHEVCGLVLEENDVVRLVPKVLKIGGVEEAAMAVYRLSNGTESCLVGFVARHQLYQVQAGMILQVVTIYSKSESAQDRRRAHRAGGMACCSIVSG